MASKKTLTIINISLIFIALLLILNLFGFELPSIGQAISFFDDSEPLCIVNWQDDFNELEDLDRCCLEVKKQAECSNENKAGVNWVCQSGAGSIKYWLNNKAYSYCKQRSFF